MVWKLSSNKAIAVLLRKAKAKYESAQRNFEADSYDTCVSDLYYACFDTVVALMVVRNVVEKKAYTG